MSRAPSRTLGQRVEQATALGRGVTFVAGDADREWVSWAQIHDEARAVAANLQGLGVGPGDHVALIGSTSRSLVTTIQAVWLVGAATVILPLPLRLGSIEEFIAQTRSRISSADSKLVVIETDLAGFFEPLPGDPPIVLMERLQPGPGRAVSEDFEDPGVDPGSLAVLQFTSGSTADPKGVMLPHAQITTNLDAIVAAAEVDAEREVVVSWLPLYHDMGLIGLMGVPMTIGAELVLGSPQDFLAAPERWLEWISEFGGTATAGPNFSYALAARAMRRHGGLDLSSWRVGFNGAEPIDPAAVEDFCTAGAPHLLDPGSVFCVFGMAEATLAVTFPRPGTGMSVDTVDGRALEHEACAVPVGETDRRGRRLAKLGTPVPDMEVRIVDPIDGRVCGDREVGELEIAGRSLTTGYYKHAHATAELFHGQWLRTGDLGYLVDGELVVCGRSKDMIIVGGRNVFPEDVERAVASVAGIRQGNVIAFGVTGRRGRERLVVVAETREGDPASIRRSVSERVRDVVGLPLEDVVLVEPGSLPKTSSGKLQRSLCKSRYLSSQFEPV